MPSPPRSSAHWLVLLAALLGAAVPWALAAALEPDPRGHGTHEQLGMQPCGMVLAFDLPCPGCGVTTSITLAGEGRFLDSLRTQPVGFLLTVFSVLFLPWALVTHLRGRDAWADLKRLPWLPTSIAAAVLVLASWVYKLTQL